MASPKYSPDYQGLFISLLVLLAVGLLIIYFKLDQGALQQASDVRDMQAELTTLNGRLDKYEKMIADSKELLKQQRDDLQKIAAPSSTKAK